MLKTLFTKLLDILLIPARLSVSLLEKYDMEVNKIFGAVFLAGIIAMITGMIASGLYPGGHDAEAKRAAGALTVDVGQRKYIVYFVIRLPVLSNGFWFGIVF